MKKIILFTGHLSALKSTISKQVAKDLNLICLNKDDIKEVLGDTIGFSDRKENLKLTDATFELLMHLGQRVLESQDVIILEANFKPHEIAKMKSLFKDVSFATFFMTATPEVLYERYVIRQPYRHPVHTSTGLISYETFLKITNKPTDDLIIEPFWVIDTTKMNENIYKSLIKEIETVLKL